MGEAAEEVLAAVQEQPVPVQLEALVTQLLPLSLYQFLWQTCRKIQTL